MNIPMSRLLRLLFLTSLIFTTLACTRPATTAPLRLQPGFSAEYVSVFIRVYEEWIAALPEAKAEFSPQYNGRFYTVVRVPGYPKLANGDVVHGNSTTARMIIYPETFSSADQFERFLRHELGHFLGAQGDNEHPVDGQALRDRTPSAWTCINAADIRAVCEGRGGCRGRSFPNCP